MNRKLAAAAALTFALAAAPSLQAAPGQASHVQNVTITIRPGDRVVEPNIALAPGVRVRLVVTNRTREFHTFTIPALHLSKLILPAGSGEARTTVVTFTLHRRAVVWQCVICPSGMHARPHAMTGTLYPLVDPSALP